MMRNYLVRGMLLAVAMVMTLPAHATASKVLKDRHGVAVNGYDVVAYFDESQAVRGLPGIEVDYAGATWYFETEKNASKFQRDPEKYIPVFGGYCAYGVSQGYLVGTDPQAWSIVDGKLYLNYNTSVRLRWLSDANNFIAIGNKHWPRLVGN